MRQTSVDAQLKEYVRQWNEHAQNTGLILEALTELIKDYLKTHPFDSAMWIKLALAQYTVPLMDDQAALTALKEILEYDSANSQALLLIAYIQHTAYGIEADCIKQLTLLAPKNPQEKALILFAQAWFYKDEDKKKFEELMTQSIAAYPRFVWPHVELGDFYSAKGNIEQACAHYNQAMQNVQIVFKEQDFLDILDVKNFIEEHLAGTFITEANLHILQDKIDGC